jgi:plasmid stability protein
MQSLIAFVSSAVASITIRNLDEQTKERLRIRAAHQGRSMEDEARSILRAAVAKEAATSKNLAVAIKKRFERFGGVAIEAPEREAIREPPRFG